MEQKTNESQQVPLNSVEFGKIVEYGGNYHIVSSLKDKFETITIVDLKNGLFRTLFYTTKVTLINAVWEIVNEDSD